MHEVRLYIVFLLDNVERCLLVHLQFQIVIGGVEVYRTFLFTVKAGKNLVLGTVGATLVDVACVEKDGLIVHHISANDRFSGSVSLVACNENLHRTARIVARIIIKGEDAEQRLGVVLAWMGGVAIVLTVYDGKWQYPLVAHVDTIEVELDVEQPHVLARWDSRCLGNSGIILHVGVP